MNRATDYGNKLIDALLSKRFQVAVGVIVLLLFRDQLGLSPETTREIQLVAIAWIVGDSLRPATKENP